MNYFIKVLKNYAVFSGRARRAEYWYYTLFSVIISIILTIVDRTILSPIPSTLWSLCTLVPSLAVGVRRMHDVGKSGWFIIIPIYNLILACTNGNEGPNEYGQDPKRPEYDEFLQTPQA